MSFDFTGKRVLVAGGSRGIGRAIALNFAAAGAAVGDLRARQRGAGGGARRHRAPRPAGACDGLRPGRCRRHRRLGAGRGRGAGRHRRAGEQRLGLRHGRRRGRLGGRPVGGRDGHGALLARRAALAAARRCRRRGQHHPPLVDLGLPAVDALGRLCGGEGGDEQLHRQPGGDAVPRGHPRQRHRAGLDRVPGRRVGAAQRPTTRRCTSARWPAFPSAAWARPTRLPRWRCSWPRRTRAG